MKYINRKTGMKAEIIKEDRKAATFMLRFEDGSTKVVSFITLNRQFKPEGKLDDDSYVAEIMQQKKDLGIECPPIESFEIVDQEQNLTDEQYAEIGKEIFEQAKTKAKEVSSKRGSLIAFNGKSQTLAAWAKELGRPQPVLYSRLYKLGWPVEKAFTK